MDSVLLKSTNDQKEAYFQAKAIEAQRAVSCVRNFCDPKRDAEVFKVADQALQRINQLVGLVLAPRLVVREPVLEPDPVQGELRAGGERL